MIPHVVGMGLATTVAPEAASRGGLPHSRRPVPPPARIPDRGAPAETPDPGRGTAHQTGRTGPMGENAPQDSSDGRVICTPQDLADALVDQFLANADSGADPANDELVEQLSEWRRNR